MMKQMGFQERDLNALGFYQGLPGYESLERSADIARRQVAAIYRDIERRRDEATARRLRDLSSKIDDAVTVDEDKTSEGDDDDAFRETLRRRL
jgi:hypothetical protein